MEIVHPHLLRRLLQADLHRVVAAGGESARVCKPKKAEATCAAAKYVPKSDEEAQEMLKALNKWFEDKKQQFLDLGKKIGADELKQTFDAMSPQVKLSQVIGHQGGAPADSTWKKLSDVPEDKILELRKTNPDEYKRLYKAEYGIECEIAD